MDKGKAEKITSLVIAAAVLLLVFCHPSLSEIGIYRECPLQNRLAYHFFHANIVHAALNAWCLLTMVFLYDIKFWRIVAAYIVASSVPSVILDCVPTIGLSGMVFYLFGRLSYEVIRQLYYQAWMMFYLIAGIFIPGTNAVLHIYCYAVGFLIALLNKPIKIEK